jgi:hypothetical protein
MRQSRKLCVECRGARSIRSLRSNVCNGCRNKRNKLKVTVTCSVCGRWRAFRPRVVARADFYHCHRCTPDETPCPEGYVKWVDLFGTPEFVGVTVKPATPAVQASLTRARELARSAMTRTIPEDSRIQKLELALKAIPGAKILTLGLKEETRVFDMHEDGSLGYHPSHGPLFIELVSEMLERGGSMIVRQFTPFKSGKATGKDGTPLPEKRVYGLLFINGSWNAIPREGLTEACCLDCRTGERLPPEEGIVYCEFPTPEDRRSIPNLGLDS